MTLETAYLHMKEMVDILDDKKPDVTLEYGWFERAKLFVEDFKTWTPEIFVYLEGGNIQGASANCSMHFNLWDDDNEQMNEVHYFDDSKNLMTYDERLADWNRMIEEDIASGKIKSIY